MTAFYGGRDLDGEPAARSGRRWLIEGATLALALFDAALLITILWAVMP